MFKVPEKYRIKYGTYGSDESYGNNGAFIIKIGKHDLLAFCIASDGELWEHVSVSLNIAKNKHLSPIDRTPTWEEMCIIKDIFWSEDDCVIQYHPPKSDYVNNAKNCLHLWKPTKVELPKPHYSLIGLKDK